MFKCWYPLYLTSKIHYCALILKYYICAKLKCILSTNLYIVRGGYGIHNNIFAINSKLLQIQLLILSTYINTLK